jgi:hypothetical protein
MAEVVANADGRKATVSQQLIDTLKAELNKVKADLADELDRVNADAESLRAFNVSHRYGSTGRERLRRRGNSSST